MQFNEFRADKIRPVFLFQNALNAKKQNGFVQEIPYIVNNLTIKNCVFICRVSAIENCTDFINFMSRIYNVC